MNTDEVVQMNNMKAFFTYSYHLYVVHPVIIKHYNNNDL
jgi:hypothetical protein